MMGRDIFLDGDLVEYLIVSDKYKAPILLFNKENRFPIWRAWRANMDFVNFFFQLVSKRLILAWC